MVIAEYKNFTIIRHTKGRIPSLPFVHVKNEILGKTYELTLIFPELKLSERLHLQWKKKPGPVNTLAFPLENNVGEIYTTLIQARREAHKYERTYHQHLLFLFIHSCLHLKGMTHGAKMEQQERRLYAKYKLQLFV